jgi:transposase InsO family protein
MQIRMPDPREWTTEQMRRFLEGSPEVAFQGESRTQVYGWIKATLIQQEYVRRTRTEKGTMRAFLSKVTGRSLAQITRLIRQYLHSGDIVSRPVVRRCFPTKYTPPDVALLAEVDRAHQRLSGPATRRIFEREFHLFGKAEFERLSRISVSHLYNLRASLGYRRQAAQFDTTKPVRIAIGERRRPEPGDQPGYLRVDTVHQGDWEGVKGVYHINAVDAVTQWEIIGCTAKISESYLLPVLEAMLHQFPFRILGFHADNGSEYINYRVAKLLNKLLAEFTKSRPNKSQDNALVEGKNGAIIRKHMGYGHIAAEHAEAVQKFYTAHFNPYLNFHRPCGFATITVDARGKRTRVYKHEHYATPFEKLRSLPRAEQYLKSGIQIVQLERTALAMSDTECARRMTLAKVALLRKVKLESPFPPRF